MTSNHIIPIDFSVISSYKPYQIESINQLCGETRHSWLDLNNISTSKVKHLFYEKFVEFSKEVGNLDLMLKNGDYFLVFDDEDDMIMFTLTFGVE